jgi:hypothetical protein
MLSNVEIPDVDLDVSDRDKALTALRKYTQASQVNNDQVLVPHNTGIYFQQVPVDPITKLSAFPYKEAEEIGYFKVDLIPNHVYDLVESNEELDKLLDAPVDWEWFQDKQFFEAEDRRYQLTHLANYHHLCEAYPPQSVEDISCLLALIRPRKKYLVGRPWEEIQNKVWEKLDTEDDTHYFFKKSHAVAFAVLVILHAQLIAKKLGQSEEYFI